MAQPIVLKTGGTVRPFRDDERIDPGFPPIMCEDCGHIMILRKWPDKRRSRLRCGMCKRRLIWVPTEEQALAAVHRATDQGVVYGREHEKE